MSPLFSSRKRQRELQEGEAAGDDVWEAGLTERARIRIVRWLDNQDSTAYFEVAEKAHVLLQDDLARGWLGSGSNHTAGDLQWFIVNGEDDGCASALEAIAQATLDERQGRYGGYRPYEDFGRSYADKVSEVLREGADQVRFHQ